MSWKYTEIRRISYLIGLEIRDLPPPHRLSEKREKREQLGITDDSIVLISVGGCSHVKRHEDIIKILPELISEYPNTVYLHLGEGATTEQEKNLAKKLNVENNIRFLGNQKNVRDFLIASDFYLMTSRFEGISITTIEALACKVPAILYNVDGLRDFNSEMQCTILVNENPKELLEAIKSLISDDALRNTITDNGFKFVTSKFYLPTNVRQIYELYRGH